MMTIAKDAQAVSKYVKQETGTAAQVATAAKDLGIDCAQGAKRINKTVRTRMAAAMAKATRTKLFRRLGRGGKKGKRGHAAQHQQSGQVPVC